MFSACRLSELMRQPPAARASIRGSLSYPNLRGTLDLYQYRDGVLLVAELTGLPEPHKSCEASVFGFHIHEGQSCTGTAESPFADVGNHYNPGHCPHPAHAGDLPPLFGNRGYAFLAVFTARFSVEEVIGRTVIVHSQPDDFKTQSSGDSGSKIGCGKIRRLDKRCR